MEVKGLQDFGSRGGGLGLIAKAHAAISKGTPVHFKMDSSGYLTQAITAAAGTVGVALSDYATNEVGQFLVEGVCQVLCTAAGAAAGDGLIPDVSDNKFKTSGGAFSGVVGQEALTHVGVALEALSGAGLVKALVNGLSCTCVA